MVRYRFETSSTVYEMDGDASSMTESTLVERIVVHIFKDKLPPFELKLVGSITDEVIVLKRCYSSRFKRTECRTVPTTGPKKKRKRRWRSPEPLLDIMRRRGYTVK